MNKSYSVHPCHCTTQLAKYSSEERLRKTGVRFLGRDEVEEFSACYVLEHKDVMRGSAKCMDIRHNRWMCYMLEAAVNQQASQSSS